LETDELENEEGYYSDYVGKDAYEPPEAQYSDQCGAFVELKVSSDGGGTWSRRTIDLSGDIDDSGLSEGEIFQHNGEKYLVVMGDFGLTVKLLNRKESVKRKK
jgi:hypothetical protein